MAEQNLENSNEAEPLSPEPELKEITAEVVQEIKAKVVPDEEAETISLVDEEDVSSHDSLHAFGAAAAAANSRKSEFNRPLNVTGQGATRCRIFRSKIAAAGLDYMEKNINEWVDGDEIEIKHVGHVIGVLEGKTPESNVLVFVWY